MKDNPWLKVSLLKRDLVNIKSDIQIIEDEYEKCEQNIERLKEKISQLEDSGKLKLPDDAGDLLEKNMAVAQSKTQLIQNFFFVRKVFIIVNITITIAVAFTFSIFTISLLGNDDDNKSYERKELIGLVNTVLSDENLSINKRQKELNNSLLMLSNELENSSADEKIK